MDWLRRIWRRRVPHVLGVYFATGWAFVEVTAFLVGRYKLTDNLVDIVLAGLLVLVPAVVVLAWNRFGRDEGDRLTRAEVLAVVLNVVGGGALMWALFGGATVGRATTTVEVTGEDGGKVRREIPRADLLRKVMVFNLAADPAAPPEPWQQAALGMAIHVDLGQDRFVLPQRPLAAGQIARMRAASPDTGGAPRRLMAEFARDIEAQYFLAGRLAARLGALEASVEIYTAEPSRLVATVNASGADVFALADALTPLLRPYLDLAAERASGADDLPVSELLTPDMAAMEALGRSDIAAQADNDFNAAFAHLERAVTIDPAFAWAGTNLLLGAYVLGQGERAQVGLAAALRGIDRLAEPGAFAVRAFDADLRGDSEGAERLRRLWVELYPQDPQARQMLAAQYMTRGNRLREALAQLEALRGLGQGFDAALLQIGELRRMLGDARGAAEAYEAYRELHPEQPGPLRALADLRLREGDAAGAERLLRDGIALPGSGIADHATLAFFLADRGRADEALATLDAAATVARTPQDEAGLLRGRIAVLIAKGRLAEAHGLVERTLAPLPNALQPMQRVSLESGLYLASGDPATLASIFAAIDAAYPGDTDVARSVRAQSRWVLLLDGEDRAGIEDATATLAAAIDRYQRDDQRHLITLTEARLAELDGDHAAAARGYAAALAGARGSLSGMQVVSEQRMLRLLLRAQRSAGMLDEAAATAAEIERLAPGWLPGLLERARLARVRGEAADARALVDRLLAALSDADADHPLRREAVDLQDSLPAEG